MPLHIKKKMNEAYVFLERFGKPGGAKGYLYQMDSVLPSLVRFYM